MLVRCGGSERGFRRCRRRCLPGPGRAPGSGRPAAWPRRWWYRIRSRSRRAGGGRGAPRAKCRRAGSERELNARPASPKGTRWLISREKRCWHSAISGVTLKISVADRSPPRRPAQWRAWHDGQQSGIRVREPGSRDTDADGRRVSRRLRRRAWPWPGLYLRLPAHAAPARASAMARPAVPPGAGTGAGRAGSCVRERSATASHSADVQLFMIVTSVRDRCVSDICHGARVLVMRSPRWVKRGLTAADKERTLVLVQGKHGSRLLSRASVLSLRV